MPLHVTYLDASAAVQLVVHERHSKRLQAYFRPRTNFRMTPFCFYETLSTLKGKWKGRRNAEGKKIVTTKDSYQDSCYFLFQYIASQQIEVEEDIALTDLSVRTQIESFVDKYELDVSDALQLLTVKNGCCRFFTGESQSLLISDDEDLVEAARAEGLRVWFLRETENPPIETRIIG